MIVVSYGTRDGVYDRFLERLQSGLDKAGLRHDLVVMKRRGGRSRAQLRKPTFILKKLQEHGETVVWLDADTTVLAPFTLPEGDWDLGTVPNTNSRSLSKNPTSSFVLALQPTERAVMMLRAWKYLCDWPELAPNRQDHKRLTWAREMRAANITEIDLSECLQGTMIRDIGTSKEAAL